MLDNTDEDMTQYTYEAVLTSNHHRMRRATEEFSGNVTYTCDTNSMIFLLFNRY